MTLTNVVVQTNPGRLLGPAAEWDEIYRRGCCPVCGLTVWECGIRIPKYTITGVTGGTTRAVVRTGDVIGIHEQAQAVNA